MLNQMKKHITCGVPQGSIWNSFYSYCTSMIFPMCLTFFVLFYLQMIPILLMNYIDELLQCMNCELKKVVI